MPISIQSQKNKRQRKQRKATKADKRTTNGKAIDKQIQVIEQEKTQRREKQEQWTTCRTTETPAREKSPTDP
jgi:hypothetical protein